MVVMSPPTKIDALRASFGELLEEGVSLARYTSARIGGLADALLTVNSVEELADTVSKLWEMGADFFVLGGGSNILVSDAGYRGLVILNKARQVQFDEESKEPSVCAESGANFGVIARQAAQRGLSGLEWAVGIPGTVGGAVIGNAGAHGGNVDGNLRMAEILHHEEGRQDWSLDDFDYSYRSSRLKRNQVQAVVLSAEFQLERSSAEAINEKIASYSSYRRESQPPGASMGSMFKNPKDDYAGRLIEEVGLKGKQIGAAQISPLHGNFFINHGDASAKDVLKLIRLAQETVTDKLGVSLELEIELVGEWEQSQRGVE